METLCRTDSNGDVAFSVGRNDEEASIKAMGIVRFGSRAVGVWVKHGGIVTDDGDITKVRSFGKNGSGERRKLIGSLDEEVIGNGLVATNSKKVGEKGVGLARVGDMRG